MRLSKAAVAAIKAAQKRSGRLTPRAVIDAARPKGSPLHRYFEWNDGRAAAAYRLDQARFIIRHVRIIIVTETRTLSSVVYVHEPETLDSTFRAVVALEPKTARQMMREELDALIRDIDRMIGLAHQRQDALPGLAKRLERLREQAAGLL